MDTDSPRPTRIPRLSDLIALMRLDRPIGTWLLMWPTLWALWLAADGLPQRDLLLIFVAGVYVMRAAGCVINDYADRHLDGHVKRTRHRPLANGRISERDAKALFLILVAIAFALVLATNLVTLLLSLGGVGLASLYPFMKRYTHLPQLFLGAAFSWAIPMAYAAVTGQVPLEAWLLFAANLSWTVAYDTQYAMVDRDDDLRVGIKSTAILFGRLDRLLIGLLQASTLGLLGLVGHALSLNVFFWAGLLGMAATFIHQQRLIRQRDRDPCFQAFLNNHWSGLLVMAGIALSLWPGTA